MKKQIISLILLFLLLIPLNVSPMKQPKKDFRQNEIDRLKRRLIIHNLDANILIKEIKVYD